MKNTFKKEDVKVGDIVVLRTAIWQNSKEPYMVVSAITNQQALCVWFNPQTYRYDSQLFKLVELGTLVDAETSKAV